MFTLSTIHYHILLSMSITLSSPQDPTKRSTTYWYYLEISSR